MWHRTSQVFQVTISSKNVNFKASRLKTDTLIIIGDELIGKPDGKDADASGDDNLLVLAGAAD
jgi:hypothetical protein